MAVKEFTKANFTLEALNSDKPVLVDFWAPWCGPCRMVGPIVEQIAAEYEGKALVGKVNVDNEGELAMQYGVMSIPTIILFKDGKVVETVVGARPKASLAAMIDKAL